MATIALFSPSGDQLALATADGRIRTYDAGTGRLLASLGTSSKDAEPSTSGNGHLMERHTCMVWAATKKDKKHKGSGCSLLVVGTAAGDVKAYDARIGELKWRRKHCIDGGVTALAHAPTAAAVYATGASSQVSVLEVESGEVTSSFQASKHPISAMALTPDAKHVLVGGSSLSLWELSSQERKAKFAGHTVPVTAMAFAPSGAYAASSAAGERAVAVWPTSPASTSAPTPGTSGKKGKKSSGGLRVAACSISTQDPILSLDTCSATGAAQENGGPGLHAPAFDLAAVSESGEAFVWRCSSEAGADEAAMSAQLLARVAIKGASGPKSGEAIMAVRIQPGSTGPVLRVARGSSAKPSFEQVQVPLPASPSAAPATITLQPASSGVLLPSTAPSAAAAVAGEAVAAAKAAAKAGKATREDVTVLGPDNMGQPALMRTDGVAAGGKKRGADEVLPAQPQAEAMEEDEEEEAVEEEAGIPLGERVAALEARAGLAGNAAAGASGAAAADDAEGAGAAAGPSGSNKADSLAVLLTQALRANDRVLLERCLSTSNARVIKNTVARLVPLDAAAFLRAAVERLLSRPARAGQLAPWIKAVLHTHTGYLMSAPGVQAPMAALYQAIDGRVALYSQLLRLQGRLALITAHARTGGADAEGAGIEAGRPAPEVVFRDDASDDEGEDGEPEAEDPFALGSEEEGSDGSEEGDEEEEGMDGLEEDDEDWDDEDM